MPDETQMPKYRCHKEVWALKIKSVDQIGCDTTTDENPIVRVTFEEGIFLPRNFNLHGKPTPVAGSYLVVYRDGYESFSPAKEFEDGYTRI